METENLKRPHDITPIEALTDIIQKLNRNNSDGPASIDRCDIVITRANIVLALHSIRHGKPCPECGYRLGESSPLAAGCCYTCGDM